MGKKYDAVCDDLDALRGELDLLADSHGRRLDGCEQRMERVERSLPSHNAWVPREEHERVHSQRDDLGAIVQDLSRKLAEARAENEALRNRHADAERRLREATMPPAPGVYARLQEDLQQAHQRIRELTVERERQGALFEHRRQEGQQQVERLIATNGELRAQVRQLTAEREHNTIVWEERRQEGQAQMERLLDENGRLRAQVGRLIVTNGDLFSQVAELTEEKKRLSDFPVRLCAECAMPQPGPHRGVCSHSEMRGGES